MIDDLTMLEDDFPDEVLEILKSLNSHSVWSKEKRQLADKLINLLTSKGYVYFHVTNPHRYRVSTVGASYLYDVPLYKQGHLAPFRGQRVRIVCTHSGKNATRGIMVNGVSISPPDKVIKTGSPMREVLDYYASEIDCSDIINKLGLVPHQYFIVSSHREENVDSPENLMKIVNILNDLATRYQSPIIFSTHPRTRKRLESLGAETNPLIQFLKPFGFFDYIKLQVESRCVLSDSGTITEESSILNFPALNIREVHERPEGFEESSVMMVGLSSELINQSLQVLDSQPRGPARLLRLVDDYAPKNVSDKVLRIILSYTDFINRKVWRT